jgi:hypothetical protein
MSYRTAGPVGRKINASLAQVSDKNTRPLNLLKDALSVLYVARSEASGATIRIHQD